MAFRVCMVDDEPWAAIDAAHSIDWARFGFSFAKHYESPVEALRDIPKKDYSLILVDIRMPEMDGLELIRQLKKQAVPARFAILSGYSDFEYARTAIRLGVQDYFVKPLEPEELHGYLSGLSQALAPRGPEVDPQFSEILEYIDMHASEKLRLVQVAEALNYNKNYLCALFQKNLGQTFVQYLTGRRLENAKFLLSDTNLSLTDISERCGFSDASYFARVFKQNVHQTPAEYRRGARR